MLEFLRDRALTEANPYETANIKKLHFLPFGGISSEDYGGRVKHVAELKDSDLYLIIDRNFTTIDVAKWKHADATSQNKTVCKKCNEEFESKGKFLAHSKNCK